MLLSTFIRESIALLEQSYPSPEARGMILILCEERLGVRNYTHIVEPQTVIPDGKLEGLGKDVGRLVAGEPLQYVLGYSDFYGRRFKVTPSVLIPRPETEMLVKEALKVAGSMVSPVRVLDLCTGSGCIAWSIKKEIPYSEVCAVDISSDALDVARAQFDGPSPDFVLADVLEGPCEFDRGQFNLVLSNPPYIMDREKESMRANVLDHEPHLALFVPDDDALVFYRALVLWLDAVMAPDGTAIFEINESLGRETRAVFVDSGYKNTSIIKDYFGKDRFLIVKKQSSTAL